MADDMIDSLRIFSNITPDTDAAALTQWAADKIERLRAELAHAVEMLRMKDDLINQQVRRILHLEGVRG